MITEPPQHDTVYPGSEDREGGLLYFVHGHVVSNAVPTPGPPSVGAHCLYCGCPHVYVILNEPQPIKIAFAAEARPCPRSFEGPPCHDCGWTYIHNDGCSVVTNPGPVPLRQAIRQAWHIFKYPINNAERLGVILGFTRGVIVYHMWPQRYEIGSVALFAVLCSLIWGVIQS